MKPFADHFSRIATGYAAYRPRYPDGLFTRLAERAPGRRVAWDCAAGTGQAAGGLAGRFERVIATDASSTQVRRGEPHRSVHYAAALAEAAPLRGRSVDLVTVAQALHWLDIERFYAEAGRALVPGGLLAVWTYGRQEVDGGPIDGVLDHFYREVVGPYWPPERRWVEAGYRGLPFPFREEPIVAPEMTEDWTLPQLLGYVSTWSATVRYEEATGSGPLVALEERLAPLWGRADRARSIRWPLTIRAGRPQC